MVPADFSAYGQHYPEKGYVVVCGLFSPAEVAQYIHPLKKFAQDPHAALGRTQSPMASR